MNSYDAALINYLFNTKTLNALINYLITSSISLLNWLVYGIID